MYACRVNRLLRTLSGFCNAGGNPTWPNLVHGFTFQKNIVFVDNSTSHDQPTRKDDIRNVSFVNNLYYAAAAESFTDLSSEGPVWPGRQQLESVERPGSGYWVSAGRPFFPGLATEVTTARLPIEARVTGFGYLVRTILKQRSRMQRQLVSMRAG